MGKNKLKQIGKLNSKIYSHIPMVSGYKYVYRSDGLEKHICKRHPDCIKYLDDLPTIIKEPDYIGVNPNERGISFELVKVLDDNVQIGIKLDVKDGYLYVATLHTITEGKLRHRLQSGRLKAISQK